MSGQTRPLLHLRWTMLRQPTQSAGTCPDGRISPRPSRRSHCGRRTPIRRRRPVLRPRPCHAILAAGLRPIGVYFATGRRWRQSAVPSRASRCFPLRPSTHFRSSLLLTPINLAWLLQVVALAGATAFVTGPGPRLLLALLVIGTYVGFVTVAGQATAWWIVGVRQQRAGRAALLVSRPSCGSERPPCCSASELIDVLDRSPTTLVVTAMANAYAGELSVAPPRGGTCLGDCGPTWRGCGPAPGLCGRLASFRGLMTRGPSAGGHVPYAAGRDACCRSANVWRSTSLRRGLYVLGLLPGVVAALIGVRWVDLPLLPALVAAGAGMLFGVNAFCLDASGALWLASLPAMPRPLFLVRTTTVLE